MSILIKGMEMPTSCGDCKAFVCYRQWAGDSGDCFCGITKSDVKFGVRNADCPLIHVPPHRCKECYNMKCVFVTGEREDINTSECADFRPMTNADRIRAMTDEELAWWISDVQYIQRDPAEWEMWLKSPVEVDDG